MANQDKNAADDILKDLEQFDSDFDLSDVQDILDGGMEVSDEAGAPQFRRYRRSAHRGKGF